MTSEYSKTTPTVNSIFVMALVCCLGGVVISGVAAHLSLPLIAWTSLVIGVAGFTTMLVLLVVALGHEFSLFLRYRAGKQA